MFSSCNELTQDVYINGVTEWKNPYGYLPGQLYASLGFFSNISLIYLIIAFAWAVQCLRFWRELIPLQLFITAVLVLVSVMPLLNYYFK